MGTFRDTVTVLLLVALAAAGSFVATGFLMIAAVLGDADSWDDLFRSMALTAGGFAVLAVVPAVVALWLRRSAPVVSGVVATFVGALAVCLFGPHASGSGAAFLVSAGGLLLVACAVPLPARGTSDTFAG